MLLTGSTGFVGACLVRRLINLGCDVHIITRKQSNKWRIVSVLKDVTEHAVDLQDFESLSRLINNIKPGVIYHLAAYGAYPFQQDINQIMLTNIVGTVNLLNACIATGFDLFVNTGSSSEYGKKEEAMKETNLLEPNNNYGASKCSATLFCQSIAINTQLPIVTLRLFSAYGPYEESTRLIPTVIMSCLNNKNPMLRSGMSVRDYIFVEDIIDLYLSLMGKNIEPGDIFNAGTGKQHSVYDVVNCIIDLTGVSVRPIWGVVERPMIEPASWVADISKAGKKLGWHPTHNIEQGLDKTIRWFRDNMVVYESRKKDV